MTTATTATRLAESTDPEAWHVARGEGVTASEIHAIHTGGRSTWRRILDDKLNGSTFKGNKHTRRGNEREAFILAAIADMPGIAALEPNAALYANAAHPLHRATPDALGTLVDGTLVGGEVKSRAHGWDATSIPTDVLYQCQWGMHTLGYDRWVLGTEVMGPDGQPTLDDPHVIIIDRDQALINALAKSADEFIAWRGSGAADDTLPDEELDAIRRWNAAKARISAATEEAKALEKQVRSIIKARPGAEQHGWKFLNDDAGGFTYSVSVDTVDVLDEDAWKRGDPDGHAEAQRLRAAADAAVEAATERYSKPQTKTSTRLLAVAPKGTKA